jgi:hypothetical protein
MDWRCSKDEYPISGAFIRREILSELESTGLRPKRTLAYLFKRKYDWPKRLLIVRVTLSVGSLSDYGHVYCLRIAASTAAATPSPGSAATAASTRNRSDREYNGNRNQNCALLA